MRLYAVQGAAVLAVDAARADRGGNRASVPAVLRLQSQGGGVMLGPMVALAEVLAWVGLAVLVILIRAAHL